MSDFITYMQKKNVFLETIIRLGVPLTYFSFAGFLMTCNSYFINAGEVIGNRNSSIGDPVNRVSTNGLQNDRAEYVREVKK